MTKVTIHAAKTNLSKLIAKAEAGEEIIIYRGDKPAAKLIAANESAPRQSRTPGRFKGQFGVSEVFLEPLPEAFLLPERPRKK
jgi:antitoxin (DNA-binding transcriptional repressor) of toxin-antitoxin stability system